VQKSDYCANAKSTDEPYEKRYGDDQSSLLQAYVQGKEDS